MAQFGGSQSSISTGTDEAARPVLSVEGLDVAFRRGGEWNAVVSDLSFEILPRQTLAMVGGSGSGKSVTAMSVMRLLPEKHTRYAGAIRLDQRDVMTCSEQELGLLRGRDVAMIFQEPMTSLNPLMPVGRQIAEVLVKHKGMRGPAALKEATHLLERVRIPSAATRVNDYPHHFSGGMRQRVMIAMALACRPKLLIADEPTTALDVTVQAEIIQLLRDLQAEEGMAIFFITHDMGVVAEIADTVCVLQEGRRVELADARTVFATPQHAYTIKLLSAVPRLGSLAHVDGPVPFDTNGTNQPSSDDAGRTPEGAPLLKVDNLVKRYPVGKGILGRPSGYVHAIENVSFSLRRGETLSLVGESGSGKSTIGRAILRLISSDSGSVRYQDEEVLAADKKALNALRRDMQIIFQDPFASLNPRMRIKEALSEPLRLYSGLSGKALTDRVAELLTQVGLEVAMMDRLPHEFSGGQRQRISIARCLAVNPKFIVADEAVAALDVSIKTQVIDLLIDLQRKLGLSYLFISHDMAVVERISHRVAVLYMGEIVEIGPRRAIFSNPQHPYTKKLLEAVPVPDPTRRRKAKLTDSYELTSPIKMAGFVPPVRSYVSVGPDHLVQR
jgi:peptide/nickel transport system ATP-binding protein